MNDKNIKAKKDAPKKKPGPEPEILVTPGTTEDVARTVLTAGKPKWHTVEAEDEAPKDED